jgi:hypothetical protein
MEIKKYLVLFVLLFFSLRPAAQELTLYVIPTSSRINWKSPRSLAFSSLRNLLAKNHYRRHRHFIGHVMVELKDSTRCAILGIVPRSKGNIAIRSYFQAYGLGVLFAQLPGKIEKGPDNNHQLNDRYPAGDIAFIRFKINEAAFLRLWQYQEQYVSRGYDRKYNGSNKPREGKGAGCSAFAVSFVELAGLMSADDLAQWTVMVNVPLKLIGGPEGGFRRVPLVKVVAAGKWADTSKDCYRRLVYYEPKVMFDWIKVKWSAPAGTEKSKYLKENRGKSKGIVIDCRDQKVPADPIFTNRN